MRPFHKTALFGLLLVGLLLASTACDKTDPSPEDTSDTSTDRGTVSVADTSTEEPTVSDPTDETESPVTEGAVTESETETETDTPAPTELVIAEPGEKRSSYRVIYDMNEADAPVVNVTMLCNAIVNGAGVDIRAVNSTSNAKDKEIIVGSVNRPETVELTATLSEGEYAIKVVPSEDGTAGKVLIAYTTDRSQYMAIEYFIDNFIYEDGVRVPIDLDVRGTEKEYTLITSDINKLRDPCILVEDGIYYAYGTGWTCYKNTSGNLEGPWEKVGTVASVADASTDGGSHWAPEVHKYNGSYYMFTTYLNSQTNHRGCTIMKSDSPEGPFVEITGGHITPSDWDAIDGTLYIDPDGRPWMVFVHEWTCQPNNVGSFAAAMLSEDLTHFISEPMELFYANEPSWAVSGVTDGCWMYTTEEGELLMIWSNFDATGYVVAVARSSNGRLDGEWIHEEKLLYAKSMTGTYDGGHGMIFTGFDGQMYLSFHSPNTADGDRKERPVFLAIKEQDGKLVWAETESAE